MFNIAQIMKQAQQMQSKVGELQGKLEEIDIVGTAGNGLVTYTCTAKSTPKSLKIDPKAVDPSDVEMLEDLILAALKDAKNKAEAKAAEEGEKLMGDMNLPKGMKLPF